LSSDLNGHSTLFWQRFLRASLNVAAASRAGLIALMTFIVAPQRAEDAYGRLLGAEALHDDIPPEATLLKPMYKACALDEGESGVFLALGDDKIPGPSAASRCSGSVGRVQRRHARSVDRRLLGSRHSRRVAGATGSRHLLVRSDARDQASLTCALRRHWSALSDGGAT
jgi:hypothetical protein